MHIHMLARRWKPFSVHAFTKQIRAELRVRLTVRVEG